jgi:photosystem II stability/assembly factor-like uncharacterized protein
MTKRFAAVTCIIGEAHMSSIARRTLTSYVAITLACVASCLEPSRAQEGSRTDVSALYTQLPWRYIGPEGNRVIAVAGVPGDPLVYYAGAASGGIWKTSDGGEEWLPIFENQPVSAIGALAVAPSDPNVIWVGTGEAFIGWSTNISLGLGVYKSMDAGRTWAQMGLEKTGRIGRLVVDPTNANVALACALGHAYGPQPERGVFRTTDGGKNWDRVLFVDANTGCSDIAMNPKNPRILLAGMWQVEMHPWGYDSGGPGSGLFLSRDGGTTWTRVTNGMPKQAVGVGKVGVAIAPSNPKRMYALIETGDGVPWNGKETERGQIWRSDDSGETWRMINADWSAMERTHYYTRMAVAPDNENETYYLTGRYSKSIDGGITLVPQTRWLDAPATDHHDMWIDPVNPRRMIVGSDQGISISLTRGAANGWSRTRLPIAQMYHVTVDNQIPYKVYGNREDGPGYIGTSNSRRSASAESPMVGGTGSSGDPRITRNYWHTINNGENGWAIPDPVNPDVVWTTGSGAGSVGGMVQRYVESRRQWRTVEVWPDHVAGPPESLKYRFNWIMPIAISPFDNNKIYVGSQHVHQTTNAGQSWQVISPDLTLNDKTRQGPSGGLTGDDSGAGYEAIVFIAESPLERGLIWAGTNDGQVQMTRDGGQTWTNLSKNLNTLPTWGWVGSIEPSRHDAAAAYLTIDFHHANNRDPHVYRTNDYGKTWKLITNGIPHSMLSWAHSIKEDPVRRGLLYLGMENGMYVSFDDGETWQPLQMNLPHAPVYGIQVQERFHDLVIATYGRGFWILDDLTPLQQLTPQVMAQPVHLFAPLPAYRFRQITNDSVIREDEVAAGNDPPYGAGINYYLKTPSVGNVTIAILDEKGQVVRTLLGTNVAGVNRVHWNLRHERSKEMRLRTSPQYAPDMRVGPEGRPAPDGGRLSILAPPGNYSVRLTAAGQSFTQPLTVIKDPYSEGTNADIRSQMTTLFELRRDMDRAADIVNGIEVARNQIEALTRVVEDQGLRRAAGDLNQKLIAVEQTLVDLRLTGAPGHTWESRLARKISYLASQLASADFKPTDQQLEVQKLLEQRLATSENQFKSIRDRDLPAFNQLLQQRRVPHFITTEAQ